MKDFFISYNKIDKEKAKWIGGCLEQNGYSVIIQAWDFQVGNNFIIEMQKAVNESERVIAVLSQTYIDSIFCQAEWATTFAKDPTGEKRLLIPIRVEEVNLSGFFSTSIYIDLFGIDEKTAEKRLLQAVDKKSNPRKAPAFSCAFSNDSVNFGNKKYSVKNEKHDIKNFDIESLPSPLTNELQDYYFERLAQSDPEAKDILIESNLRLVIHIAKNFFGKYNYSNEDIISVGTIGLAKAVSNFDPKKNMRFQTYAARMIENEILIMLRKKYKEGTTDSLELESLKDILVVNDKLLDNFEDKYFTELALEYINNKMDDIEKAIIKYRYGFCGKKMTQREVADMFGISRSYVSRIEKRALIKMQNYFDKKIY